MNQAIALVDPALPLSRFDGVVYTDVEILPTHYWPRFNRLVDCHRVEVDEIDRQRNSD
jgi:hypothetical protein